MALSTPPQDSSDVRNGIPYRRLGRTGEMVSLIGLGGYHLGRQADEQETIRIVRTAVDNGINFLDNRLPRQSVSHDQDRRAQQR